MTKTFQKKVIQIIFFSLLECLILFTISCGLDSYEVFESPYEPDYPPNAIEGDVVFDKNYVQFFTNEPSTPYSTITYLGTAVYYKIYNSPDVCRSEYNTLRTLNNDTENSAKAAERMISNSSSGYNFKLLKSTISGNANLNDITIPKKGKSQDVYIRLTDFTESFPSKITVDGVNLNNSSELVKPIRNLDSTEEISFNFGRYDSEVSGGRKVYISDSNDPDVHYSTNVDNNNVWYVSMFAVGVARDINYSLQYSNIAYLGTLKIDSNSENN